MPKKHHANYTYISKRRRVFIRLLKYTKSKYFIFLMERGLRIARLIGKPNGAFYGQGKRNALTGCFQARFLVEGVKNVVIDCGGDEDHDDLLFGMYGDLKEAFCLAVCI